MKNDLQETIALAAANYSRMEMGCPKPMSMEQFLFYATRETYLLGANAVLSALDAAGYAVVRVDEVEALLEQVTELRGSSTNDEGLLPCPECHSISGPYLYWWQRGQAWIIICSECKHEAQAREDAEYKARTIWNDEARAAIAAIKDTGR